MLRSVPDLARRLRYTVAAFLFAGTGLPPEAVASNSVTDIAFQSGAPYYEPPVAVVPMGTLIRWVNTTASFHSVRHDACVDEEPCPFQSIAIPPENSFVVAPLPPGRYPYHCELHPIMKGTLLIVEPSSMNANSERPD